MARSVAHQIFRLTGRNPVDVEVINDRDAIVQMEPEAGVVPVTQALHTINKWEGFVAEITCLKTSCKNMVGIIKEQDDLHHKLQQREQDMMKLQQEQKGSQEQMVEILQNFREEVKKVEEMRTHVNQPSTPVKQEVAKMEMIAEDKQSIPQASSRDERKIEKPPQICIFSGSDPIPKDEGSYEQWEFQVRGAMATHTKNSVHAAIVNSLQGPAQHLIGFVGFDADIERILDEVTGRFGHKYTRDKLQQEFYQLQEKGEKLREFAGRLESIYQRLHEKLLEQFNQNQLKDRLFYGINQSLQDLSRYLFKDTKVTYLALLAALEDTENEYCEVRTAIKSKSTVVEGETGITDLREKIEALTTVVKSSNIATKSAESPKLKFRFQKKDGQSPSNSPAKGRGPGTTAAGPFKMGQKPIQFYNCRGWGNGWRNCPTTGNVDWSSLNRAKALPTGSDSAPGTTTKSQ